MYPARCPYPRKSGLDILKELHGEDYPAPIFMISGQGDIAMAVSAIKNGALDFIEKPFRGSEIVARLDEAIEAYARRQAQNRHRASRPCIFPGASRSGGANAGACSSSPPASTRKRAVNSDQPAND